MKKIYLLFIILIISSLGVNSCKQQSTNVSKKDMEKVAELEMLTPGAAGNFARLAFTCIRQEYPNKLSHVMNDSSEVKSPKALHPVFYGCFDWHSCVHGYWMLVHLLRTYPDLPHQEEIRSAISERLTPENIRQEITYLHKPNRKSFERTYGWAWLLKLAEELNTWDDPDGKTWAATLAPLADEIAQRYKSFLPVQEYPIRRGVHPNTAFGLIFALDYARQAGDKELEKIIIQCAKNYYYNDHNAPVSWEPDGDDFLSPALQEASLMLRILPHEEFLTWLYAYLPGLGEGIPSNLFTPANVRDRSDPKIVHLDGLNLSRAWSMFELANALDKNDPAHSLLIQSGIRHAQATLPYITSGNYEGEHWLASFAVYMYSRYHLLSESAEKNNSKK
ncbi:MAG: DUF2891 domain-containing protein [Chlorobi bacterium]|nr:DUF2891 domain-containing protein [Chlorobiota bacterium]